MTDALEMYKGVLLELDSKFGSEEFDVEDFNYFIAKATEKWFSDQLDLFEETQKVSDKISCMITTETIVFNATNGTADTVKVLPGDYRHLVNCLVSLRYKTATGAYAINAIRKDYSKRYTGDGQASLMDNFYLKPLVSDADVRLYHRIIGNELSILTESVKEPNTTIVIASALIEYFEVLPNIELDPADNSIVTDTPFAAHANREIVTLCAQLFLEENESQRLQTHAAVNQ